LSAAAARIGPSLGAAHRDAGSCDARTADYVGVPRRHAHARPARISLARRVCCAVAICALASAASAQLPSARARAGLELSTRVEKIVAGGADKADARAKLVPAADLTPGDELVITVTFLNTTQHALDGVRITQPIPPTMRYVQGSGVGPGSEVLYSVDGGATYGQPNELGVVTAGVRRVATADDYTHVRWLVKAPLAAGARAFVRFRATVRATPEASAAAHADP
jgi:uncharacterized repeat protein (TIGR01451 family)